MHDSLLVRSFERCGDLAQDGEGVGQLQAAGPRTTDRGPGTFDDLFERRPLDELHRNCVRLEPVDLCDVWMIERGQHFGLELESAESLHVARELGRQDFERDVAVQPGIAGAVDLPHSAFAQFGQDFVRADSRPWGQGHEFAGL
jgi:hypothetical protein